MTNANTKKTWEEAASAEEKAKAKQEKANKELNGMSDERKQEFDKAGEEYNVNSYNGIYDTVMSVDATEAEREAYYNYIRSKRSNPWKKSWAEAKAKVEKERKSGK